ncbi:MAG: hypothetical protein AVDCRST_MAG56-1748 [uncultured Cytophagales bacterium]|uniref:Uncharacterized protein n=1 Tax=uncultured Cytophagales bacterium TaxID=158755 RepID=A0A6J4IBZ5_9SPHI|nr:MAG: hypothetical protein AVDCRST_MAG56-1748 [uncultured Cytophagales bacterium]
MPNRLILRLLFPVLLLTMAETGMAQHYLQLTRLSNGHHRYFKTGNRIRYKLRHDPSREMRHGRIQVITDSGVWVNDRHIPLDSLSYIGSGRLGVRIAAGAASTLAGLFIITHISGNSRYGIVQYLGGQVLIGLGTLEMVINGVRYFTTTRYDLERKWSIKIRQYPKDPG